MLELMRSQQNEYMIGPHMPPRMAISRCLPALSPLGNAWNQITAEWPVAERAVKMLIRYLGTELQSLSGPLIGDVIEPAVRAYATTASGHEYRRLHAFLVAFEDATRRLPNIRLKCGETMWSIGNQTPLPRWLRRQDALRTVLKTRGTIDLVVANRVMSYCVDDVALAWLRTSHIEKSRRATQ
jgi:hypothetical protein